MKSLLKLKLFFFFFILISINVLSLQEEFIFSESFGTIEINTTTCLHFGDDSFFDNYSVSTSISPTFDHDWKCITEPADGFVRNSTGNTTNALTVNAGNAGCTGNCESSIAVIFEESIGFRAQDSIQFYCNNLPTISGTNPIAYLSFQNDQNEIKFSLAINDNVGNACALAGAPGNCCEVRTLYNNNCTLATVERINLNFSQIDTLCTNINSSHYEDDIDLMSWEINGDGTGAPIDDITLKYVSGENELPNFNVTLNNSKLCFNGSQTNISIPVILLAEDPENDIISYGVNEITAKDFNESVWFNFKSFGFNFPDFTFKDSLNQNFQTCVLNEDDQLNTSLLNLVEFDNTYHLSLSSTCTGINKGYIYKFPNNLQTLFYGTVFKGLNSENEEFNLSLYSSNFEIVSILNFRITNGMLNVSEFNGSSLINNRNFTLLSDLGFSINFFPSNLNQSFVLLNNQLSGIFNLTSLSNNAISYIWISNQNGVIYHQFFTYSGVVIDPVFSTDLITNISVESSGKYFYDFFVTDSEHITFKEKRINVIIPECQFFMLPIDDDFVNDQENIELFAVVKGLLSEPLQGYLRSLGLYEFGKKVLWWFFVIMFLTLIASEYLIIRKLDIVLPLIISGWSCFLLAWLLDYVAHQLTFLIFLSFGLGIPIAQSLIGNSGGNGGNRDV